MSRLIKHEAFFKSPASGLYIPVQDFGPELLVNGDFSDGLNGWTKLNDNGSTATITETAPDSSTEQAQRRGITADPQSSCCFAKRYIRRENGMKHADR
ncbi:MAG: hypothetical protein IPO91_34545 [Chloroflexi bacterium]|nr:hypothetical protein [Chloroflexota bacterium]